MAACSVPSLCCQHTTNQPGFQEIASSVIVPTIVGPFSKHDALWFSGGQDHNQWCPEWSTTLRGTVTFCQRQTHQSSPTNRRQRAPTPGLRIPRCHDRSRELRTRLGRSIGRSRCRCRSGCRGYHRTRQERRRAVAESSGRIRRGARVGRLRHQKNSIQATFKGKKLAIPPPTPHLSSCSPC